MSINLSSLTTDQLLDLNKDVVALIKERRRQKSANKRAYLSLGDTVRFNTDRNGGTLTGTVTKIMRTRCHVEVGSTTYRCYIASVTPVKQSSK